MSLSISDIAEIIGRHFWRMVLLGGLCAGAAGWALLSATPTYEARTLLLYKLGREYIYVPEVGETSSGVRSPDPGDLMQLVGAEMQIFVNSDLRRRFLETFGIERVFPDLDTSASTDEKTLNGAVQDLSRIVTVGLIPNTVLAEVRVRHGDPEIAAEMANALVDLYLTRRAEVFNQRDSSYFRKRLAAARRGAEDIEFKRRDLMGGLDPLVFETEREIHIARQSLLETQIAEAEAAIAGLSSRRAALDYAVETLPPTVVEYRNVERNPIVSNAQSRVLILTPERDAAVASLGPAHPNVRAIDREIEGLRQVAASQPAEVEVGGRIALNEARIRAEVEQTNVAAALREMEARRDHLIAEREANAAELAQAAAVYSELSALKQAAEIQLSQVAKFEARLSDSTADEASGGDSLGSVRILERAAPPAIPIDPPKSVRLIVAVLFGGIVGLAAAALSYLSRPTVLTPRMLEQSLGAPTLAEIDWRRPRRGASAPAV